MSSMHAILPPALVDELIDAARHAHPAECCAIGLGERPGAVRELVHVANVANDPRRGFDVDSTELATLLVDARRRGLELTLVAHSHPSGDPRPSARDRADATGWPGVARMVVTRGGLIELHD